MDTIISLFYLLLFVLFVVDAVIIALFIYVTKKAAEARPDIMGAPVATTVATNRRTERVQAAWSEIEASAAASTDGKRLAVINADRLVDALLKEAGYEGEGALERMRQLPAERVATVNDLLAAHRFRNRLVHEANFTPDDRALETALAQYRAFLTEVGYL